MNHHNTKTNPVKTDENPTKYRLMVFFKNEFQKPDRDTGELRKNWFWNGNYLVEYYKKIHKAQFEKSKFSPELLAIRQKLKSIKGKFNKVVIYDRRENSELEILLEWTPGKPGEFIGPEIIIEFFKPAIL